MIVFDDNKANAFYPLTLNRSVGDLRCGILKLRQRLQALFADDDSQIWLDPGLKGIYAQRHPDWQVNGSCPTGTLWVNSRLKADARSIETVKSLKAGYCLHDDDTLIAFRSNGTISALPEVGELTSLGYNLIPEDIGTYENLSDIIQDNERMIRFDFAEFFYEKDNYFETEPGVTALNPYNIWIGEDVRLKPGVVLDASDGPIVLDEGVRIMPNAVVTGPVYIGKKTLVKVGAKIYPNTSIGPVCKVGGEVEGSIIQAYSNKQHDGFLGHSYIGEWVNIGADTNNSDLKNTYKNVKFHSYAEKGMLDSQSMFLGALIADHVKLGINTSLNTGCVIGLGSNLWGPDLIAGFIPDFSWGTASKLERYRFDAFLETARIMKQRRGLGLSDTEIALYQDLYTKLQEQP